MLDQFNQLCVKAIENSKAQNIVQTNGQVKCVEFLNSQGQLVISLFQTLIYTVMFEHHTNMWVYQRPLHSSVNLHYISGSPIEDYFKHVIQENETNPNKQQDLFKMVTKLLEKKDSPISDEGRSQFSSGYTVFKNEVTGFNTG